VSGRAWRTGVVSSGLTEYETPPPRRVARTDPEQSQLDGRVFRTFQQNDPSAEELFVAPERRRAASPEYEPGRGAWNRRPTPGEGLTDTQRIPRTRTVHSPPPHPDDLLGRAKRAWVLYLDEFFPPAGCPYRPGRDDTAADIRRRHVC
jgi:hypothetical protein